ncbi:MAG TPA: epimerase, partial [Humibacillus xanthopallidus]|nr:epimerase [Humibacillus xanthopallidus]
PTIHTSITDYFSLPIVPIPLGFDARFQLVHEDDAIAAMILATTGPAVGIVNVAGDGFVTVTQCTALARRPVFPVPLSSGSLLGAIVKRSGLADFSTDQLTLLAFGRGLDTTRMRTVLGFEPKFTSRSAFEDFARHLRPAVPGVDGVGDAVSDAAGGTAAAIARVFDRIQP